VRSQASDLPQVPLGGDAGANSNPSGYPSIYFAEDGSLVVQGPLVDAATHANLRNVLPGEGEVHIAADVVREAMVKYEGRSA
jgi:hypothetical protein